MTAVPLATADLPGTGGILRAQPEDFVVEEVPAYEPSGAGEHVYLWVEKRGLTTADAARILGKRAGVRERDIGTAGLKDKRAVTRQYFSLALRDAAPLEGFEAPGLRVLRIARHGNKLRTGHLRGNRFTLAVRGVGADALEKARAVVDALAKSGVPNAYGPQRFGRDGSTASLGRALLSGEAHPDRARAERDRYLRRLALSAFQSQLFNDLLARRMREKTWHTALSGDVLQKPTGASFVCEDPGAEQVRIDRFELSVAGPMFGPKMLAAREAAREHELAVLAQAGVEEALFSRGGELTQGARRALRIPLGPCSLAMRDDALWIEFALPRGSYASVVMGEVMKSQVVLEGEDDD